MQNRHPLKISLVSVPFSGHSKILVKLAQDFAAKHPEFELNFIVTGWKDVGLAPEEVEKLKNAGIRLQVIDNNEKIPCADPMKFNLARVAKSADAVVNACEGSDYVIYDFFAMEGYLAGKKLNIPAICSMPAIMGPFNPDNALYQEGLAENDACITALEKKFDVSLRNRLEMVSDAFYLPSDSQNIIWSWEAFIKKGSHYHQNRNKLATEVFMRPALPAFTPNPLIDQLKLAKKAGKKIIYLSLGTVVTKNLWDHEEAVKQFVNGIFKTMIAQYGDKEQYEVVISAGRNPADIEALTQCPSNFHVFESVDQLQVLREADVFVTHGGGNSTNDAIDLGTPMVAIPFFGDQHVCAENIHTLRIGKSFLHEPADREKAINTHAKLFSRKSFSSEALIQAIEEVLHDPVYKQNIVAICNQKPAAVERLSKAMINRHNMHWQEGDLLYGSSIDRCRAAEMTLNRDFLRMGNETAFSTLFADSHDKAILPRIADQYNDVLKRPAVREDEIKNSSFINYRANLAEFGDFLRKNPAYLQPIGDLDAITPVNERRYLETLWSMCLGGIDFFTHQKHATIHFVVGAYNSQYSEAPIREISWIKHHWHDAVMREHVKFYLIQDGMLTPVDPVAMNWFQDVRPTPTLTDVAPRDCTLDQTAWKKLQDDVISTANHRCRFFQNHLRSRYPEELKKFRATDAKLIKLFDEPEAGRRSLEAGEVHLFALRGANQLAIVPKHCGNTSISHAVAAEDEPVLSAGEVRMRRIQVKGKWLNVLEISNDSGHYMPTAEGFPKVIAAFEKLGFIVHRVHAIHTQIKESFDQVEKNRGDFAPLYRSATL